MRRLRNVRLFKSGVWKGDRYTNGQLDEAVENFRKFQTPGPRRLQRAPIIVGHGPEDLDDDRIPKRGDILSLRRDGDWLVAPEMDADDELADAIENGHYDDLSAELYPSPPEGVPGKGLMLRRVAILGGDIPHIKGLNPEGLAAKLHSERRRFKVIRFSQQGGECRVFSEERSMDRDAMMTALVGAGMSHDVVEGMDDMQLGECMKVIQGAAPADGGAPAAFDESQFPADKDAAGTMCKKMRAMYKEKFGEELPNDDQGVNGMTQEVQPQQQQFSESERADIVRFCETYADRIDPAELDEAEGHLSLVDVALRLDNTKRVHKFTEGGVTKTTTERNLFLKSIRDRKIRYGDRKMKTGQPGTPVVTFAEGATKKDKIKAFAESHGQHLAKIGMKPEEYVSAWEAADDDDKAELERGVGFTG